MAIDVAADLEAHADIRRERQRAVNILGDGHALAEIAARSLNLNFEAGAAGAVRTIGRRDIDGDIAVAVLANDQASSESSVSSGSLFSVPTA